MMCLHNQSLVQTEIEEADNKTLNIRKDKLACRWWILIYMYVTLPYLYLFVFVLYFNLYIYLDT